MGRNTEQLVSSSSTGSYSVAFTNVTKITRLAIPGFWSNERAPWKSGFSHQVRSQGCSKWSSFSWKFLSELALMTSLDGKNRFFTWKHHLAPMQWKMPISCGNSQPCNLSNVGLRYQNTKAKSFGNLACRHLYFENQDYTKMNGKGFIYVSNTCEFEKLSRSNSRRVISESFFNFWGLKKICST